MKKYVLLFGILLHTYPALAEGRIGIKCSPSISFARIHTNPNNLGFKTGGTPVKLKIGVMYDHNIQANYWISTGAFFAFQRIAISNSALPIHADEHTAEHNQEDAATIGIGEQHDLQYVQIPLLLKLYTSEVKLDMRIYVDFGLIGQIRFNDVKNIQKSTQKALFIEKFRRWGLAGLVGVGFEYDVSLSTSLFAGASYQRGLSNIIEQQHEYKKIPNLIGYNDMISLDVGVRF